MLLAQTHKKGIPPIVPLTWHPGPPALRKRLQPVLRNWEHTPFMAGQCCPGVGVDCTHFVCAVVDELYGRSPRAVRRYKPGTGSQSIAEGARAIRELRGMFPASRAVRNGTLQPADVVVLRYGRGPNHAAIVGFTPNTLWHCSMGMGGKVSQVSLALFASRIIRAYRMTDREVWYG